MKAFPLQRFSKLSRSLALGAGSAISRFPVAVLLVLVFSVVSNLTVADAFDRSREIERILAALSGAAAASVAFTLGLEGRKVRPVFTLLLSVLIAVGIGLAIWLSRPFPIYAPSLLIACVAAIPLAPYLGRGNAREFWSFTLWTAVGVVLAFLSVLIFLLGVTAILEMVRYLFRVGLGTRAYEHLFTTALTLVGPLFALGRIPTRDDDHTTFQPDDRLVRTVRPLFDWVSAPLALATALVLHVYVGRILVSGEVPRGEIGWIVSLFSFFVLALRIAIEPFKADGRWPTRIFADGWVPILIVPLGLLVYALELRVDGEGFTVERYYLGLWAMAVAVVVTAQAVPRWRGDIRVVAAIPVVLLAASTFGPWGVADVVGRSQAARIESDFATALSSAPDDVADLSPSSRTVLVSRLRALEDVAELPRIRPLLKADLADAPIWDARDIELASVRFLVGLMEPSSSSATRRTFAGRKTDPLDVGGYDRAFLSRSVPNFESVADGDIRLRLTQSHLQLTWQGEIDDLDLVPIMKSLPLWSSDETSRAAEAPVDVDVVTKGARHVRLRVERAVVPDKGWEPWDLTVTILLRSSEWPVPSGLGSTPPPSPRGARPPATR